MPTLEQKTFELYPGYHAEVAKRERVTAMQIETLRQSCAEAIGHLAEAIARPTICRAEIENAMRAVPRAYAAACMLDPKDEEL